MRIGGLLVVGGSAASAAEASVPCTAAMLQQYSTAATEYSDCIKKSDAGAFCECVESHVSLLASLPTACTEAHVVKESTIASTAALCPAIRAARRLTEDDPQNDDPQNAAGSVGDAAGSAAAKYTHGAPPCISDCFVHYAFDKQLPRGMEPQCDLWSEYIFGPKCDATSLKHTCAAGSAAHDDVLIKCIDTGCDAITCMGADEAAMTHLLEKPAETAGCSKIFYTSRAQQCRADETACAAAVARGKGDIGLLQEAFCSASGSCAAFGSCIKEALVASRCSGSALADGYTTFASTEKAVCDGLTETPPCRNDCKDAFVGELASSGKLALDGKPTPAQTCDYYRDFVFGSGCATAGLKTWNVPAVEFGVVSDTPADTNTTAHDDHPTDAPIVSDAPADTNTTAHEGHPDDPPDDHPDVPEESTTDLTT